MMEFLRNLPSTSYAIFDEKTVADYHIQTILEQVQRGRIPIANPVELVNGDAGWTFHQLPDGVEALVIPCQYGEEESHYAAILQAQQQGWRRVSQYTLANARNFPLKDQERSTKYHFFVRKIENGPELSPEVSEVLALPILHQIYPAAQRLEAQIEDILTKTAMGFRPTGMPFTSHPDTPSPIIAMTPSSDEEYTLLVHRPNTSPAVLRAEFNRLVRLGFHSLGLEFTLPASTAMSAHQEWDKKFVGVRYNLMGRKKTGKQK